jgi:hypothetical protein
VADFVIVDALGATITDGFPPYSRFFTIPVAPGGTIPPRPPVPPICLFGHNGKNRLFDQCDERYSSDQWNNSWRD